jgi:parvulin-like peptidyl-prolyl isomerase
MRRLSSLVVAPVLVALVAAGCTSGNLQHGVAAFTVNGHDFSQQSFDQELELLAENPVLKDFLAKQNNSSITRTDGSIKSEVAAGWLTLVIQQELAKRTIDRRGTAVTPADRKKAEALAALTLPGDEVLAALPAWFRSRIVRRLAPVAVLERDLVAARSDEIKQALKQQCASGRFASHILVRTEAEANVILTQLNAGKDFAQLAKKRSIDKGSARQGGYLGCIDGQQFVAEFATAATTQPLDQVSQPVKTQFGFHLIFVTDLPAREVDAVALGEILAGPRTAHVEVDPRYGTWDAKRGRVTPPKA